MTGGMVRRWFIHLFMIRFLIINTNVYDKEQREPASVITEDLVQKFDECLKQDKRFTILSLSDEFSRVPRSVLTHSE